MTGATAARGEERAPFLGPVRTLPVAGGWAIPGASLGLLAGVTRRGALLDRLSGRGRVAP